MGNRARVLEELVRAWHQEADPRHRSHGFTRPEPSNTLPCNRDRWGEEFEDWGLHYNVPIERLEYRDAIEEMGKAFRRQFMRTLGYLLKDREVRRVPQRAEQSGADDGKAAKVLSVTMFPAASEEAFNNGKGMACILGGRGEGVEGLVQRSQVRGFGQDSRMGGDATPEGTLLEMSCPIKEVDYGQAIEGMGRAFREQFLKTIDYLVSGRPSVAGVDIEGQSANSESQPDSSEKLPKTDFSAVFPGFASCSTGLVGAIDAVGSVQDQFDMPTANHSTQKIAEEPSSFKTEQDSQDAPSSEDDKPDEVFLCDPSTSGQPSSSVQLLDPSGCHSGPDEPPSRSFYGGPSSDRQDQGNNTDALADSFGLVDDMKNQDPSLVRTNPLPLVGLWHSE